MRRETFRVQRHTAVPMETRGLVAVWDEGQGCMTVSGITKVPFFNRTTLAAMLDLPESSVVMKVADAGGGFGVRGEFYPEDFLIPFVARKLNRPVKWVEDRREHFLATNHSRETACDLEIACDRNGIILGLRGEVTIDIGAYARGTGGTSPTRCAQFLPGPYRIPNFACTVNAHVSNKTPSGTYRGPGRVEANFFRERLIDIAAGDLGIDPAEIRRRNFVTAQEMPFNIGKLVNYEPPAQFDSGDFGTVFEQALKEIGWTGKQPMQGRMSGGRCHGIGFASFVESSAGGLKEQARIRLNRNGTLDVFVGSTSSGQSHETVFAQVCADALHLPMDRIRIICASTDELEEGFGTWHSRSAVMSGNAVRTTAQAFIERLKSVASEYFGRPNVALDWREGRVCRSDTDASANLEALAGFAADQGESVDVTAAFEYTEAEAVQLRHPRGPRCGRSAHRRGRIDRLHRHRGYRPRAQSAGRARPGAGRRRPGARRNVPGAPALRRGRPVADRIVRRLPDAVRHRLSQHPKPFHGTGPGPRQSARRQRRGRRRHRGGGCRGEQRRVRRAVTVRRADPRTAAVAAAALAARFADSQAKSQ